MQGYASSLLKHGVHPKIASEALGHASVAFTLDTYSHVVPGLQEAAARAIEEALGNRTAVTLPSSEWTTMRAEYAPADRSVDPPGLEPGTNGL